MFLDTFSDVKALVEYVNEIKPYHTKLKNVAVEYRYNENLNVVMTESKFIISRLAGLWCLEDIANGSTTTYRIPAVQIPRYTAARDHQWIFRGVLDEDPNSPASYRVPYNNGMRVYVNDVLQVRGTHYEVTYPVGNIVQFLTGYEPILGDTVKIDLLLMDRIHISLDGVGQTYAYYGYDPVTETFDETLNDTLEGSFDGGGYDMFNFDQLTGNFAENTDVDLVPIGRVKIVYDENNQPYYVFIFNTAPARGTVVRLCIEQQNVHNNRVDVRIEEQLTFAELLDLVESMNVRMVEPFVDAFDIYPFDEMPFAESFNMFNISSEPDSEPVTTGIVDSLNMVYGTDIGWPQYAEIDAAFITATSWIYTDANNRVIQKSGNNTIVESAVSDTTALNGSRHYWETVIVQPNAGTYVGIIKSTQAFTNANALNVTANTVAIPFDGTVIYVNGVATALTIATIVPGDIISHALDLIAGTYSISVNGGAYVQIATGLTGDWYVAASATTLNTEINFAFDEHDLTYTPPAPQPQGWRFGIFINV